MKMIEMKRKRIPAFAILAVALYAISFTSEAAATMQEKNTEVEMTVEVHQVSETTILNDSTDRISSTIATVSKKGEKKAQQMKKEKEEQEARERARKQAQKESEELLAAIIFCEAGNQPYEGQVAVGAVILNRVQSALYPNSIEAVIYQRGQFGPAQTGKLDRVRRAKSYTKTALQAARDALAGVDPVEGCLYFGCGNKGIKIGAHYFH